MTTAQIQKELLDKSDAQIAKKMQYFFKTGKGEYGEGDIFIGLTSPQLRTIAKKYSDINLAEVKPLLESPIHEERLCAVMLLAYKFEKNKHNQSIQKDVYDFYMNNLDGVNNWDLVDLSSYKIAGAYLINKDKTPLYELANSGKLWLERIAVISTLTFIKKNDDYSTTFDLARKLMHHKHDLMHKAIGWMLREIGKRNQPVEEAFLLEHYQEMPRTMLRYAIEKFEESKRQDYLKGRL